MQAPPSSALRRAAKSRASALRSRAGVTARSLVAAGPLLARRRLRRDGPVLITQLLLTAFVFFLAVATPSFVGATADRAAREAVATAQGGADLTISVPVAPPSPAQLGQAVDPAEIEAVAGSLQGRLPDALSLVYDSTTTTVLSGSTDVLAGTSATGEAAGQAPTYRVRFGLLTDAAAARLALNAGALPSSTSGPTEPIDAVISAAGADAAGLVLGDQFSITGNTRPPSRTDPQPAGTSVALRIAAVARPSADPGSSPTAPLWSDEPEFWNPAPPSSARSPGDITVLLSPAGLAELGLTTPVTFDALLRIRFDPERFTTDLMGEVNDAARRVKANNTALVDGSGFRFVVNTDFGDVAEAYFGQLRASNAQLVVVLTGLLAVGICAMVMIGHLIALGRRAQHTLERARGSSFTAIGLRAVAESALVTLLAGVIGIGCSAAVSSGPYRSVLPIVLVAAVSLLVTPAQTIVSAGGLRRQRAAPRDRQGRVAQKRLAQVRRVVLDVAVLGAALAAVTAFRSRGVASGPGAPVGVSEVDPLLAAAPLLLALALSAVVLRVVPLATGLGARLSRRSPGVLGVLGTAGATRALQGRALLPLLALTLGVGLAAGSGFFAASIESGQHAAALQRVGADVRVDGPVTEAAARDVLSRAGVSQAARVGIAQGSALDLGTTTATTTLLAVDSHYAALVDEQRARLQNPGGPTDSIEALRRLAEQPPSGADDPLPVVVDPRLTSRLVTDELVVSIDQRNIRLHIVGTAGAPSPGLSTSATAIYVDLDQLAGRLAEPLTKNALLVDGPGARAAVDALAPGAPVSTADGWFAEQQALPLVNGVQTLFAASIPALALLTLVALVATALAGSRTRARDTALLRTMGFATSIGSWLTASELGPVIAGGLLGGISSAVGIVLLLGPALDLASLTGGTDAPALHLPPGIPLAAAAAAVGMFALTVLGDLALQRRRRMTDVLRVGETV